MHGGPIDDPKNFFSTPGVVGTGRTKQLLHVGSSIETDRIGLFRLVERVGSQVIFTGWAPGTKGSPPDKSAAIWLISRKVIQGSFDTENFNDPVNENYFKAVWNNKETFFSDVPFLNQKSLFFNGSNAYLEVLNAASLNFGTGDAFTLMKWIKSANGSQTLIEKMDGNQGYRFNIIISGGNRPTFEFRGSGGTADRIRIRSAVAIPAFDDFEWHLVAATHDGSDTAAGCDLWLDGAIIPKDVQNDGLVSDPANTDNLSIGARSGGGNYFDGFGDEPAIYNINLDEANMAAIYNLGIPIDLKVNSGDYDKAVNLVSAWRNGDDNLDDPDNNLIVDVKSNNNATMINMVPGDVVTEVPSG